VTTSLFNDPIQAINLPLHATTKIFLHTKHYNSSELEIIEERSRISNQDGNILSTEAIFSAFYSTHLHFHLLSSTPWMIRSITAKVEGTQWDMWTV
jgi:hypothetical protein